MTSGRLRGMLLPFLCVSSRCLTHPLALFPRATPRLETLPIARDVYTRRQEGVSIWVVRSSDVTASDPGDAESLFEPARDKIYRHPTFYAIPDEVKNL